MIFRIATSLAIVAGMFSAGSARAVDIYNTLSQSSAGTETISIQYGMGVSFKTTATDYVIDAVTFKFMKDTATSGNITIAIYDTSGAGGTPGSIIGAPLGTVPVSSLTSTLANYTLNSLNRTLSPSTNYYLTATSTDITSGAPRGSVTQQTTGLTTGSVGYSFKNNTWTGPYSGFYGQASISATAVPEPSTYALGAIATGVFAFIARRCKARRA
jgi:hypothetical protein